MATRPTIFKWRQTEPALILCAVRWYLHSRSEWRVQGAGLIGTHPTRSQENVAAQRKEPGRQPHHYTGIVPRAFFLTAVPCLLACRPDCLCSWHRTCGRQCWATPLESAHREFCDTNAMARTRFNSGCPPVNWPGDRAYPFGDPDEQAHPVVNRLAPLRESRREPEGC